MHFKKLLLDQSRERHDGSSQIATGCLTPIEGVTAMYDIAKLANLPQLRSLAPTTMAAFENFDRAAMAPGAIPRRYKELIALGVALATQCPYSLEVHRTNAENAGVTEAEIAEVVFLAATMRATAAIAHGTHLVGARKPAR
ncbi:MAG TPA: carboxymuconolactone decarboxylase family protein [Hyphomicrobium sp.]|uniref:carboxymuconolactone decarboxylase family protein n=1 Tax=Hyphomicrobium sp. TaxID=82 RepID=UPI002B81CF9A|nr:carboxymuconolactone decarboxylase family protein [Hyphomicrobium sp.]HXE02363.1 carboxymuconolactone decarboxylase family protein [Hyphomicrobium sp.]